VGQVCDGRGACQISAEGRACVAYACAADQGCKSTCSVDADCTTNYRCFEGSCISRESASCIDDRTARDPTGTTTQCEAYVCAGGACPTQCTTQDGCLSGFFCDFDGRCKPPATFTPLSSCSATQRSRAGDGSGPCALAFLLAFAAFRRGKVNARSGSR